MQDHGISGHDLSQPAGLAPSLLLIRSDQNHCVEQKKCFVRQYYIILLYIILYYIILCYIILYYIIVILYIVSILYDNINIYIYMIYMITV